MDHQRSDFPNEPNSESFILGWCFVWIILEKGDSLSPACSTISSPDQMVLFSFPSLWHSGRVAPWDRGEPDAGLGEHVQWHSDPNHHHMCHSCCGTAPVCHQPDGLRWEVGLNCLRMSASQKTEEHLNWQDPGAYMRSFTNGGTKAQMPEFSLSVIEMRF